MSGTVSAFGSQFRASSRADCDFQPKTLDDAFRPVGVAERCASVDATPQGRHLGVGLRLIDVLTPLTRTGDGPFAEHGLPIVIPFQSVPKTAPRPVFRPLHQIGAQSISLNVPADREKVLVILHGEGLEAALIKMARPDGVVMCVPPLRVSQRQPAHELGQIAVASRPQDQVPMIRHQTIRENPHVHPGQSFFQDALERRVVFRLLKDRRPRIRAIQNVKHHPAVIRSFGSSHDGRRLTAKGFERQQRFLTPFLPPTTVPDTFSSLARSHWERLVQESYQHDY